MAAGSTIAEGAVCRVESLKRYVVEAAALRRRSAARRAGEGNPCPILLFYFNRFALCPACPGVFQIVGMPFLQPGFPENHVVLTLIRNQCQRIASFFHLPFAIIDRRAVFFVVERHVKIRCRCSGKGKIFICAVNDPDRQNLARVQFLFDPDGNLAGGGGYRNKCRCRPSTRSEKGWRMKRIQRSPPLVKKCDDGRQNHDNGKKGCQPHFEVFFITALLLYHWYIWCILCLTLITFFLYCPVWYISQIKFHPPSQTYIPAPVIRR